MIRKFVTLHDEKWLRKNCICREDPILKEKEWVPKIYTEAFTATLLADNEYEKGMYKSLVGKTIEVELQLQYDEPSMDNYGFKCIEGAPYNIPTWLIKAYWECAK